MNKLCLLVLVFSAQVISMQRPPTPDEIGIAQDALAKEKISFESTQVVKKPYVELLEVDKGDSRYLIDLRAKAIVNRYHIAERP